jgi:L-seryl-tRNA(Ser) seleniumtransferase
LEATLDAHRRGALEEVPLFQMLGLTTEGIEARARDLARRLEESIPSDLKVTVISGSSAIGGGSGPNVHPPTALLALSHETLTANEIESKLRAASPPIIARIADGQVLLDLRTVDVSEESDLLTALKSLSS